MAGTTVGKLNTLLTADSTQFDAVVDHASQKAHGLNDQLSHIGSHVGTDVLGMAGFALGIGGVIAGIHHAISAAEEAYVSEQNLEAVLHATGEAAGFSAHQLIEYAESLSRATGIHHEAIISAETALATFTNIQGDVFTRTISLAADLASVMKTDVSSAAFILGKALADPEKGLSKLARAGIVFNAEQRNMVKHMIEVGDTAGAQVAILEAVAGKVEGAAVRARSSWVSLFLSVHEVLVELGKFGSTAESGGIIDAISALVHKQGQAWKELNKIIGESVGLFKDVTKAIFPSVGKIGERLNELLGFGRDIQAPQAHEQPAAGLSQEQQIAIEDLEEALQKQIYTFGLSTNAIKLWELKERNIPIDALKSAHALIAEAEAMQEQASAALAAQRAYDAHQKSLDSIIHSIEEQNATIGMTNEQMQIRKLLHEGATEQEIEYARSVQESSKSLMQFLDTNSALKESGISESADEIHQKIDALFQAMVDGMISQEVMFNEWDKLWKDQERIWGGAAERIHESVMTPMEKLQKELEDLTILFEGGWVSVDDYQKKLQQFEDQMFDLEHVKGLNDIVRPAAIEFGTAEAFSKSLPTSMEQNVGDRRAHELLQRLDERLGEIGRGVRDLQPVHVTSI